MDSSPDCSEEMVTEEPEPQVPAKNKQPNRRAAAPKKPLKSVDDDDEDDIEVIDDDDFEPKEKKKRGGGRKPANAKATNKPPLAATKKWGPAANNKQSQSLGQKLIIEVQKPAENSPKKKVRKMRASPFNKKSSSIIGRTSAINLDDDEEEVDMSPEQGINSVSSLGSGTDNSEVVAPKGMQPQKGNMTKATYVISDDEADEDTEDVAEDEDDDSDFDE